MTERTMSADIMHDLVDKYGWSYEHAETVVQGYEDCFGTSEGYAVDTDTVLRAFQGFWHTREEFVQECDNMFRGLDDVQQAYIDWEKYAEDQFINQWVDAPGSDHNTIVVFDRIH